MDYNIGISLCSITGYDARSANRWPRSPLRVEIGRPCRTRFLYSVKHNSGRPLDRRIGAALRLRLRYGGRRRSSHLGLNTEHLLRSHSVRANKKVIKMNMKGRTFAARRSIGE